MATAEYKGYEPTPYPALLDVVKVDGRWAQTMADGHAIRYLDNDNEVLIDWNKYNLTKKHGLAIKDARALNNIDITDAEVAKVTWASDQDRHPALRSYVMVFGEYVKK